MGGYTIIGKLNRSFGSKGGMRYTLYPDFAEAYHEKTYVFLLLDGLYVPFFKDTMRNGNPALIFLLDVITVSEVDEIAGNYMYMPNEDLPELPEEDIDLEYRYLKGFSAYELEQGLIGQIDHIKQYPMQEMAIIDGAEEILIPLNKDLIHNIDHNLKKIFFDLPEGLLDIDQS